MKRRGFLHMLGAAVAAPLLPARVAQAGVAKAACSPAAVHAAIYHAQSRAVFSVWGLAKAANLTLEQATAVMEHLAERGILGPLQGTTIGGRWANSQILQRHMIASAQAARASMRVSIERQAAFDVDLSRLLAHLRKLSDGFFDGEGPKQTA